MELELSTAGDLLNQNYFSTKNAKWILIKDFVIKFGMIKLSIQWEVMSLLLSQGLVSCYVCTTSIAENLINKQITKRQFQSDTRNNEAFTEDQLVPKYEHHFKETPYHMDRHSLLNKWFWGCTQGIERTACSATTWSTGTQELFQQVYGHNQIFILENTA